jgi:ligand-binding sensor domain-containing protein
VIVDGKTGTERWLPQARSISVLVWNAEGIYLATNSGLVIVNPRTGAQRTLRAGLYEPGHQAPFALVKSTIWMYGVSGPDSQSWDELLTQDLSGGPVRAVFKAPASKSILGVIGFDERGHPVYEMGTKYAANEPPSPIEIWALTDTRPTLVVAGNDPNLQPPFTAWDSNGVWIGSWNGIVRLYTASRGLQVAARLDRSVFPPDRPDDNPPWTGGRGQQQVVIVGRCQ